MKSNQIIDAYKSGEIDINRAIDALVLIIESDNLENNRAESLTYLEKLDVKNKRLFKIAENCLISDISPMVRSVAIEIISTHFLSIGLDALEWTVSNEKSPLVVKVLFDTLERSNNPTSESLKKQILGKYTNIYEIHEDQAQFFLDLEYSVAKIWNDSDMEIGAYGRQDINPFKVINGKVSDLVLRNLDLCEVPESIQLLTDLYSLDLTKNNLSYIPKSFTRLFNLKQLSLARNYHLKDIQMDSIRPVIQNISVKYIDKGILPDEAEILALLEIISGKRFKNTSIVELGNLMRSNYAWNYILNKNGNITGIFLKEHELKLIGFIPKEISNLENLENLDFSFQAIKIIPESIQMLKKLKHLALSNNFIENIPSFIDNLRFLETLDLSYNNIQEIPNSILSLKNLKKFNIIENRIEDTSIIERLQKNGIKIII